MIDSDFTLAHFTQREAARFPRFIRPRAVYRDPVYPDRAAIVVLPFDVDFRCETVFWYGLTYAQRQTMLRDNRAGACAALIPATLTGSPTLLPIVFVEEDLAAIFGRWVCFIVEVLRGHVSVNLLKAYYAKSPRPRHAPNSYEAAVINYDGGYILADHPNLRRILLA